MCSLFLQVFMKIIPIYCNGEEFIRLRNIAIGKLSDCTRNGEGDERVRAMKYLRIIKCVERNFVQTSMVALS